jgi:hypothetical protein
MISIFGPIELYCQATLVSSSFADFPYDIGPFPRPENPKYKIPQSSSTVLFQACAKSPRTTITTITSGSKERRLQYQHGRVRVLGRPLPPALAKAPRTRYIHFPGDILLIPGVACDRTGHSWWHPMFWQTVSHNSGCTHYGIEALYLVGTCRLPSSLLNVSSGRSSN